jgi:hypothetical protein
MRNATPSNMGCCRQYMHESTTAVAHPNAQRSGGEEQAHELFLSCLSLLDACLHTYISVTLHHLNAGKGEREGADERTVWSACAGSTAAVWSPSCGHRLHAAGAPCLLQSGSANRCPRRHLHGKAGSWGEFVLSSLTVRHSTKSK